MRFSFKKSLSHIKNRQNTSQTYTEDLRKGIQETMLATQKKTKPRIYFLFRTTEYVNFH